MSKDILKALFRRAISIGFNAGKPTSYGTRPRGQIIMPGGFEAGGDGRPTIVYPGPDTVAIFDDFHAFVVINHVTYRIEKVAEAETEMGQHQNA